MKNMLLISFIIFNLSSCHGKNDTNAVTENKFTKENKMISNNTIIYALSIDATADFKVYINDVLVTSYYGKGATSLTIPINREILFSGEQVIKVVLNSINKLDKNELKYYKFQIKKYVSFSSPDYQTVLDCQFDHNLSENLYSHTQSWIFKTEVPYKVEGWTESSILLKEDEGQLLREVISIYESFRKLLEDRDSKSFLAKTIKRDTEINEVLYLNKEQITEDENQTLQTINSITNVLPLENYKLVFYGNGRMVALIRMDGKKKDQSALQAQLEDNSTEIYELLLHRPKSGSPLEVIR